MNSSRTYLILFLMIICTSLTESSAQCEVKQKLDPNGILYHYSEPVKVYWTEAKSLYCGAITDEESYYLQLYPFPFPDKQKAKKLKSDVVVKLNGNEEYSLSFYDSRYINSDSVFAMLFIIPEKKIGSFLKEEIEEISLDLGDDEGPRTYRLKLHKSAIKEQLKCLEEEADQ